jgi:rhodanese-related sulfurtransferase
MNRFVEYTTNHPFLVAAAVMLAVLVAVVEFRQRARGASSIGPTDAVRLVNQGGIVLDVRSAEQFAQGHIIDARNIPSAQLASDGESLRKWRDKPVIVCCDAGVNSAAAARTLRGMGFTKVMNLRGGLAAWQQENLPLVKKSAGRKEVRKG